MVGWFQVSLDGQPPAVAEGFKGLVEARRWREAFAFARSSNMAVAVRDTLFKTTGGEEEQQQAYSYYTWGSNRVSSVTNEDDADDSELLTPQ
jgi:hypothetical protein